VSYVRATAAVTVVDGVGIGIGLWIVGVPLAIPLATLVFLGAFIPIIGAVVTGAVAVLVALVTNGFVTALIVLAIVVGVMQLEGNVLQPLLLGRAVRLHPLAVILAITAGMTTAGITGALLSVPLLAVLNSGIKSLAQEASEGDAEPAATTAPAKRTSPTTPGSDSAGGGGSIDEPPSTGPHSARKEPAPACAPPRVRCVIPRHRCGGARSCSAGSRSGSPSAPSWCTTTATSAPGWRG